MATAYQSIWGTIKFPAQTVMTAACSKCFRRRMMIFRTFLMCDQGRTRWGWSSFVGFHSPTVMTLVFTLLNAKQCTRGGTCFWGITFREVGAFGSDTLRRSLFPSLRCCTLLCSEAVLGCNERSISCISARLTPALWTLKSWPGWMLTRAGLKAGI